MRVLLIDDAEDIRRIGQLSLERIGKMEARLAASVLEGLSVAETWQPDLILMDVMMPEMDGMAGLAAIRKVPALRQVPVVFLTARAQPDEVAAYLALGAAHVLAKPFDPMTLPAELRRVLAAQA